MDATIKSKSFTISVLIHLLIFLILFFVMISTPIPPFPEAGGGGGVLVNIGYQESASGDVQPTSETTTTKPQPEEVKPQPVVEDKTQYATQDIEDATAVEKVEKKNETKPVVKPKENVVVKPKEKPKEPVKSADPRAMYQGKNTNSKSQGTATTGTGDQGNPQGDPNSTYYGKQGTGNGTGGGDGGGNGGGHGPGTGPGSGPGINYNLSGRTAVTRIKPDDTSQDEGVVVVSITVDKDGNVTNALPGAQGSTTTSTLLYSKAKQAALKWKFNKSDKGFETQKGTIQFIFKNQ